MINIYHIINKALLFLMVVCLTNSASATVYNVTQTGDGTTTAHLRGAIMAADAAGGTHTINVPAGTYNLTMGQIMFGNNAQNISIVGAGSSLTIVNMTNTNRDRIFMINPPGTIADVSTTITGIKFTNGYLTSDLYGGGAIICGGPNNHITISNCVFDGNTETFRGGGALWMSGGGFINIDQCSFINNRTESIFSTTGGGGASDGGAINIQYYNSLPPITGTASITNCSFIGNSAYGDYGVSSGGAIRVSASESVNSQSFNTVIRNNTFTNNSVNYSDTDEGGGAISIYSDFPVSINYNYFNNNITTNALGGTTKKALLVGNSIGNVDATNNWWGCNTDPQASGTCSEIVLHDHNSLGTGIVTTQPQLVLKTSANTNTLCPGAPNNSTGVTASVLQNSAGTTMSLANLSRLIGMPLNFSATNGTISNAQTTIQPNGTATATYTSTGSGTGKASALAGYLNPGDTYASTNIITGLPPVITTQPGSVSGCSTGTVTMNVTASGAGPLSYQWYKGTTPLVNNSVISGVTTATITFTHPTVADNAANYKVVVSGTCGSTTSSNAALSLYTSRLYVANGGTGNGSSWSDALGDLHAALTAVAQCNSISEIYVAVGEYHVGSTSFIMKNNVAIYGGFDPTNGITDLTHNRVMPNASSASQGSILNGDGVRPVIWNVFTAATAMNNTAILDGFTIYNGSHTEGGGIRNVYASPTFRNLVIRANKASSSGAGIYNDNSSPLITNTVISNNTIVNTNTSVNIAGAGIYNLNTSAPVISNTTITGNTLFAPVGTVKGAGIFNKANAASKIYNSILWNNQKMGNAYVAGADIENDNATVTVKNSITQLYTTGSAADNNKVTADPLFTGNDFQLSSASPAINAGNNTLFAGLNANTKDLANNPRLVNGTLDLGAYEYQCISIDFSAMAFDNQTFVYNGNPHGITIQNLPQGLSATYQITNAANQTTVGNTATNAGVYTIKATLSPTATGTFCNLPLEITATLIIDKASTYITANSTQTYVYDGATKNVSATINHNETSLVYTPQQGYIDAGTYPVMVLAPETNNYMSTVENINLVITKADFSGVTFNSASFTYDGNSHSIFVTGAPAGTTVTYTGNTQINTGVYTVNALVQKPNYNDMWLSATMTINNPLPLNLLSFTAEKQNETSLLQWVTAMEQNNTGFDVERSDDSKNWTKIGFVKSLAINGNSKTELIYQLTDHAPLIGKNFYRLKQIDFDGKAEYSQVRTLSFEDSRKINVYPNPAREAVTITGLQGGETITIHDISGKAIQSIKSDKSQITIKLNNLSSGSYTLRITAENEATYATKLTITK